MRKPHMYFILTMRVSERASMASVLSKLQSRGVEVLHFDEQLRTVVVRAHVHELPFVKTLVENYASSATLEFKASMSASRHLIEELLKSEGRCAPTPVRTCLLECEAGLVLTELKGRKLLMKYCRRTIIPPEPAAVPPSLCVFTVPGSDPLALLEESSRCFSEIAEKLEMLRSRKASLNTSGQDRAP